MDDCTWALMAAGHQDLLYWGLGYKISGLEFSAVQHRALELIMFESFTFASGKD